MHQLGATPKMKLFKIIFQLKGDVQTAGRSGAQNIVDSEAIFHPIIDIVADKSLVHSHIEAESEGGFRKALKKEVQTHTLPVSQSMIEAIEAIAIIFITLYFPKRTYTN